MAPTTSPDFGSATRADPGFFGKVPARGDFLDRHVPQSVAAQWEAWLQALTVAVRDSGARGWQDAWLTAPLWHFALGADLASPAGVRGALVASADRVGRLFPFTVIAAAGPAARLEPAEWAEAAETLILDALGDEFDPAAFERDLQALGPPPPIRAQPCPPGAYPLAADETWPDPAPGHAQSEWWTRGSDRLPPTRLRCNGLPTPAQARAMVLGGL